MCACTVSLQEVQCRLRISVAWWWSSNKLKQRVWEELMWAYRSTLRISWAEKRTNEYILKELGVLHTLSENSAHIVRQQSDNLGTVNGQTQWDLAEETQCDWWIRMKMKQTECRSSDKIKTAHYIRDHHYQHWYKELLMMYPCRYNRYLYHDKRTFRINLLAFFGGSTFPVDSSYVDSLTDTNFDYLVMSPVCHCQ